MSLFYPVAFSKIKLAAAIILLTSIIARAQEPELKKRQAIVTSDAVASYYTFGKNTKQGLFQIWNIEVPKVRVQGGFTNNKKSGNWVFFNSEGQIIIRHNYTLNKLITYDAENLKAVQIRIFDGSDTLVDPNIREPLFLVPYEIYHNILVDKIRRKFPASHYNRKNIDMTVTAMVDSTGLATYSCSYLLNGYPYRIPFKLKNDLFQPDWLPARLENKAYRSEVSFTVKYWAGPRANYPGWRKHTKFLESAKGHFN